MLKATYRATAFIIAIASLVGCNKELDHAEALKIANTQACPFYKSVKQDCQGIAPTDSTDHTETGIRAFSFGYLVQEQPLLELSILVYKNGVYEVHKMDERP